MEVESGLRTIVGVNKFQVEEEAPKDLLRVDASVGVNQAKKTQAVRANRDQAAVDKALTDLKAGAADENVNLMPLILAAVKHMLLWVKFVMYCAKYSVNTKLIPHYNIG